MPLYDFGCPECDYVLEDQLRRMDECDSMIAACPVHGEGLFLQVLRPPAVESWADGRHFEHLAPAGITFYDKGSYKRHLRDRGLQEWSPRRGMPGCEV